MSVIYWCHMLPIFVHNRGKVYKNLLYKLSKKHVLDVHNNNFNVYLNGIESYLEVIDGDNLHVDR